MLQLLATRVSESPIGTDVYKAIQSHVYGDFWAFFRPEAVLLVAILVMLVLGMTDRWKGRAKSVHLFAAFSLLISLVLCLGSDWESAKAIFLDFGHLPSVAAAEANGENPIIGSMLVGDGLSHFFRVFLLVTGLLTVWMGASAKEMRDRSLPEFYILFFGSLVGMMLLASATHMLMVYLAIEMMSLPSYALVALRRKQRRATEASLKYMLFGSVASGAMVYGLSLIYGMSGGLGFADVADGMATVGENSSNLHALGIGLFLFIVGIGYKMAIAPMHFWCPDAYEGAPTPVTAFLSVASKAAGFAAAIRFVWVAAGATPEGALGGLQALPWVEMLVVIGILTMTVGNFTAIRQSNIKRMLAYSSIAHAGYLMIGVAAIAAGRVVGGEAGNSVAVTGVVSVAVYMVAYLLTNYGAFAAVVALENQDNDNEDLSAFKALAKRNLFLAICIFVVLLSLLGVPPTVGFFGKVYLFFAGVEAFQLGNDALVVMLIAAGINTAVSAYYYFKVARAMFLEDAERGTYRPFQQPTGTTTLVTFSTAGILVFFVAFAAAGEHGLVKGAGNVIENGRIEHDFRVVKPDTATEGTAEPEAAVAPAGGPVAGR